jgi:hypothetical protein
VAILSNGQVRWDGAPATGQWQDCPQSPGVVNYAIQAFGANGQMAQTSRDVSVASAGTSAPVILSFTVDNSTVKAGAPVTLRWDVGGGASNVAIERDYIVRQNLTINGSVLNGYTYDTPVAAGSINQTVQVGYRLVATNPQGQAVQQVIVVSVTP